MSSIDLSKIPTTAPDDLDKDEARKISKKRARRIADLHQQLVAQGNVFGECTPFGLRAVGWKKPTDLEFAHDFLWRIHKEVPAKGEMVIFNRSHYEDVLIQRVHGWIDEETVDRRFAAINAFEQLLAHDNNTLILKFYLHLSKEQQAEELMERVNESDKHYKHNDGLARSARRPALVP